MIRNGSSTASLRCTALRCVVFVIGVWLPSSLVFSQSGLRESLERLDRNQDGKIAPNEITPLARPYLERIAEGRRLQLDKSNDISTLQEAARVYYALKNGVAGYDVEVESKSTVQPFGIEPDKPLIPEFGLIEVKYPYAQVDLDEADRILRRNDVNIDGFIDRTESKSAKWTHNDPFEMDLNHDDQLSRMELAQRYARRRLLSGAAKELVQKAKRTGNGIQPTVHSQGKTDDSSWWRQGGSSYWLTASILGRFDLNQNGRLEEQEAKGMGISIGRMDIDLNGEISRDELYEFLKILQEEAGDESSGLPGWFFELDTDRDGQVAMVEFTADWSQEKLEEFELLDSNADGLLTAEEVAQSKSQVGGSYRNTQAQVLPPHNTVISEIEIDDDFIIGEVSLKISLTHTSTGYLDGFLSGPDGQRIELFSEVGGSGDNFDGTIFDDKADTPIVKGKSPFTGSFLTTGRMKKQPSLSTFAGTSAKGVWQLVVRATRSDRFGMLHDWSLNFKTREVEPNRTRDTGIAAPPEITPQLIP